MRKELLFYGPDTDRLYVVHENYYDLTNSSFFGETIEYIKAESKVTITWKQFDKHKNNLILIGEI